MYAGRVACCPLVSHVEYASRAVVLRLEKTGQTDGHTDRRRTVTLSFPLDAARLNWHPVAHLTTEVDHCSLKGHMDRRLQASSVSKFRSLADYYDDVIFKMAAKLCSHNYHIGSHSNNAYVRSFIFRCKNLATLRNFQIQQN